jgi:hypothetical protein
MVESTSEEESTVGSERETEDETEEEVSSSLELIDC